MLTLKEKLIAYLMQWAFIETNALATLDGISKEFSCDTTRLYDMRVCWAMWQELLQPLWIDVDIKNYPQVKDINGFTTLLDVIYEMDLDSMKDK